MKMSECQDNSSFISIMSQIEEKRGMRMKKMEIYTSHAITVLSLMERSIMAYGKITEKDKSLAKMIIDNLNDKEKSILKHSYSTVFESVGEV